MELDEKLDKFHNELKQDFNDIRNMMVQHGERQLNIEKDLDHVVNRVDEINGSVKRHETKIQLHEQYIEDDRKWKNDVQKYFWGYFIGAILVALVSVLAGPLAKQISTLVTPSIIIPFFLS